MVSQHDMFLLAEWGHLRAFIEDAVRRATGATEVQLSEQTDRTILGGAIIQIGDHIVDGSVRARLAGLRRNIAGSIS